MRLRKKVNRKILTNYDLLFYFLVRQFLLLSLLDKLSFAPAKRGPITGETPCCLDRLTSIICKRQKQQNPALFLYKCMQNSDFAFVQCCQTCFDQRMNDTYHLDYHKTSELLLTNPTTAQCANRRSDQWCDKFMHKRFNWTTFQHTKMDCSNVPIAFRLCRKSCGYCASPETPAQAVYNYPTAKDAYRCHNPSKGIAQHKRNIKSRSLFDSFSSRFARKSGRKNATNRQTTSKESKELFNTKANGIQPTPTHSPSDYFMVTDHDYKDYENNNSND